MIGLAIIIVLLVLLLPQALFIVPQQNVYIIERLGKFNRTVGAGLNLKIPFFETIAAKVDMRTRQEQFGIDAKTRDNVTVTMAIAAQYRVSAQPGVPGTALGRVAQLLHAGQSHGPDALLPHRRPALQRAAVHPR